MDPIRGDSRSFHGETLIIGSPSGPNSVAVRQHPSARPEGLPNADDPVRERLDPAHPHDGYAYDGCKCICCTNVRALQAPAVGPLFRCAVHGNAHCDNPAPLYATMTGRDIEAVRDHAGWAAPERTTPPGPPDPPRREYPEPMA